MKKISTLVFIFAVSLLLTIQPVFAEGGKGSGGGNGGGKEEPLIIEVTTPKENGVLKDGEEIVVTFSKNIAHESVREANEVLVDLTSDDGKEISIIVEIADEQVDPEHRNDIVIKPTDKLEDGKYKLVLKSGISSKSGDVLEEDYVLTFTVGDTVTKDDKKSDDKKTEDKKEVIEKKNEGNYIVMIVGGLVGLGLIVVLVTKKKK